MRALLVFAMALLGGCQPPAKEGLALAPCHVTGLGRLAECGVVEVAAGDERVALRVVRLPADGKEAAAEPLFLLAGGPGQGAIDGFAPLIPQLGAVSRERAIVLVDMRGTGSSAPLACAASRSLAEQLEPGGLARVATACRERHRERDLSRYTTAQAVADLEAVREALGYDTIDLLGVSYGTRLAMSYARAHPTRTRALVLDGVAPYGLRLPLSFARDAQAAFDRVVDRCRAEPACHAAFPDPAGDLREVLARLTAEPRALTVHHPTRGEPVEVTLGAAAFALLVREALYVTDLHELLPFSLSRARAGDFAPLLAQDALLTQDAERSVSLGLLLSVACAEDLPRIDPAEVEAATADTFLGSALYDEMREACRIWGVGAAPVDPSPLRVDVPTLALSGGADPATPPRWADEAIAELPRRRHVVIDHAGHGALARGCVPGLVARFLRAPGEIDRLDTSCSARDEPAPFFVSPAGPPP
jgi:pimeloyl-ACP methyl ester carboxylesterase